MAMDPKKKPTDREKGIMQGKKNTQLLTNLEIPEDYHGSQDLYTPQPDAHESTENEG